MAHLFLASKISIPDDFQAKCNAGVRTPRTITAEKKLSREKNSHRDQAIITTTKQIPHVNEIELTAATGGAEMSCYRCTVPFGVVILIAGVVVTAVAYTFNSHGSTISTLGLIMLAVGLGLLGSSAICWRLRTRKKRQDKRRESQTALMASQGYCIA